MAKRIETQLMIKAVDRYSDKLKGMGKVTGRFADRVRADMKGLQKLRGPLKMIEDFKKLQAETDQSREAFERQKTEVRRLRTEMKKVEKPTAKMRREFEKAQKKAERLRGAYQKHRGTLSGMNTKLREAGVNTGDLAGEQRRLSNAVDRATGSYDRRMDKMRRLGKMQNDIAAARERMDRTLSRAANLNFVGNASMMTGRRILRGISSPVQQAIEFETAMSDVRKVVDFDSPQGFKEMSDDILKLSTRIPMAAEGLAQIVAAGGQSGIPRDELLKFAEMAAKVGVAFDISADSAGSSMASIKTAMGLSLKDTGSLFDAMNHLSNNSAARADQTLEFLNRAGAAGASYGFDNTETLAIGAAMIAAGAKSDTAATSFRNMGKALTKGESATDRQAGAFKKLGLNAAQVAKDMQEDAVGTTTDVLRRLKDVPDHMRAAVMSDLFGDEARELGKLVNNMQLMPDMLKLVAKEQDYLGSSEAEYAERAKTTSNNMQLLRNQMTRLGVSIGEVVLPHLNDLLKTARVIVDKVVAWTKANPKLTKALVMGGVALGAMAVAGGALLTAAAGLIGTLAVLRFGLVGLGARALFSAGSLTGLLGRFRALSGLRPSIKRPNLKPHLTDFADFRRGALREVASLEKRHGRAMDRMAKKRVANRALWGGMLSGVGRFLLRSSAIGIGAYLGLGIKPTANGELTPLAEESLRTQTQGDLDNMHERDTGFRDALDVVRSFKGGAALPTAEKIAQLREDVAAYHAEIEAAQEALSAAPEFGSGITNPLRVQAQTELDAAESGLRQAQDELANTERASDKLKGALKVLDATVASPEINTESFDRALRKIAQIEHGLKTLPGGKVSVGSPPSAPGLAGRRARGGSAWAGLPYLVNENTPRSEIFVPSSSGGILNVGQAKSAMARGFGGLAKSAMAPRLGGLTRGLGNSLAAMAVSSAVLPSILTAPPGPAASAAGRQVTQSIGNISIHVTAPSGVTDPERLAGLIEQRLGDRLHAEFTADFSD